MIGRLVLLTGAAAAAAGAILFGRRKARQQARAQRRAERQAKRARTEGMARPVAPAIATGRPQGHKGDSSGPAFTSIKGIGPAIEARLRAAGVTSVAQIAAWSDEDIELLAPSLKVTAERIRRDAWVEQARAVMADGEATG